MTTAYDFTLPKLQGGDLSLADFSNKVVLLVNVASECGLTAQYSKLQALYERLADKGLVVLGVPCNQFAAQEPGTDDDIRNFCDSQYSISFPLSGKIDVNGESAHPLYQWLTGPDSEFSGDIEWNFAKFIINRYGDVVARLPAQTEPDEQEILDAIDACL
ncbi:MAG: glutathione peroxidase [Pseudomonadales bacterium]